MTTTPDRLRAERRGAVGIFLLVFSVYVLTYIGAFKSNDERALVSGIDSFIKRGEFTVNQIYWDYTNVGMFTNLGDMVPNYEPAQMVLAIPFYLWGRVFGAAVQGTLFFNAVVTAAAVALLYLCLLELGYQRRTSTLGALVFAFATLAWPYSRTFFREPLTMLAYLLAVYGLLRYRLPAARGWVWPALAGCGLGLALTTKQISVALIPSLVLLAIADERHRPPEPGSTLWRDRLKAGLAGAIPLVGILILGRIYNLVTLGGVELFARDIVDYTTNPQLSQSVPIRMLRAGLGITVSPYKGLFWYCPVLLLGLVGAIRFTRRHPWEGVAYLMAVGTHLLGYSRYNYWSGGVAWGMRYLLPIIPFLVLLAAPAWAWMMNGASVRRPRPAAGTLAMGRIAIWLLILVSIGIQILGISVDLRTHEVRWLLDQAKVWGGIGEAIEALYLQPAQSPIVGHLRLLLSGTEPLDFAWVQRREMGTWALAPAGLILSVGAVALGMFALVWVWRKPARAGQVGLGASVCLLIVCSLLLIFYRRKDTRFDPYGVDRFLQPLMADLKDVPCGWHGCGDALIVPDPGLTDYFLNYLRAPLVWYAVDAQPVDARLMEQLLARYGRVWLARDRNAQSDDNEGKRGYERYLAEHAYKLKEQQYENWARLLAFSAAGHPAEILAPDQALGEMILEQATLRIEATPAAGRRLAASHAVLEPASDGKVQAKSGDTLQVGLRWRAMRQPAANYTVFVQLLDAASQVKAQKDRWPGDGLYPTAALSAGQTITDNLALALDVPAGRYRLITGMYRADVAGYPRLGGPDGDFVTLAEIEVK